MVKFRRGVNIRKYMGKYSCFSWEHLLILATGRNLNIELGSGRGLYLGGARGVGCRETRNQDTVNFASQCWSEKF